MEFNSANALPGDGGIVASGSSIAVAGPATGLAYVGSSALSLSRDLTINTGYLTVKLFELTGTQPTVGSVTLAGMISGVGGMNYQAQTTGTPAGEISVTNIGNTYTGPTRFTAGTTHIAGDGCTGVGGGWSFAAGISTAPTTLTLEGDVTNSRHVNFEGGGVSPPTVVINTNGHNMDIKARPLTKLLSPPGSSLALNGSGGFGKNGAGTLTLNSTTNLLPGVITVSAGTLLINGNLGPSPTNAVTVAGEGAARWAARGNIYRNVTISGGGTLAPGNSPGILSRSTATSR